MAEYRIDESCGLKQIICKSIHGSEFAMTPEHIVEELNKYAKIKQKIRESSDALTEAFIEMDKITGRMF